MIRYAIDRLVQDPLGILLHAGFNAAIAAVTFFVALLAVAVWAENTVACAVGMAVLCALQFRRAYAKHKRAIKENAECRPAH